MPFNTPHRFIVSTNGDQMDSRQRELQISDIRSHARHVSYLKWRNGTRLDLRMRTKHPQQQSSGIVNGSQSQTAPARQPSRPSSALQRGGSRESTDSPLSYVLIDDEDVLNDAEAAVFLRDVWMPNPAPAWSKGDPFECIPGSNEMSARIGLDFLTVTQWCWPAYASISRAFGLPVVYHCHWMLEQIAKYQSLFHIIVAHTKACHDLLTRPGEPLKQEVHIHKMKSIAMLRKRLLLPRAAFDDGVILTAVFLSHHEAATGDARAATMHCQRVYQLIEARGGVHCWGAGTGIRALIDYYQDLTSNSMQENAMAIAFRYPQLPMSVGQLQIFRRLPEGFQDLALTGDLTIETIDIILKILDTRAGRKGQDDSRVKRSYGESSSDRNVSKYRILNEACPGLSIPDSAAGPALERLLCTALMRACIDESHRFKTPGSLFQSITSKLQRLLPLAIIPSDGPERSCLLWIWTVMVDSWPAQPDEVVDWLHRMRGWFPEIKSWTSEDFVRFGQRYLWTTDLSRIIAGHWPLVS